MIITEGLKTTKPCFLTVLEATSPGWGAVGLLLQKLFHAALLVRGRRGCLWCLLACVPPTSAPTFPGLSSVRLCSPCLRKDLSWGLGPHPGAAIWRSLP